MLLFNIDILADVSYIRFIIILKKCAEDHVHLHMTFIIDNGFRTVV